MTLLINTQVTGVVNLETQQAREKKVFSKIINSKDDFEFEVVLRGSGGEKRLIEIASRVSGLLRLYDGLVTIFQRVNFAP